MVIQTVPILVHKMQSESKQHLQNEHQRLRLLLYMCSQPADKYPHHFSKEGLFGRHAFALPTVIAAVLSLLGMLYL